MADSKPISFYAPIKLGARLLDTPVNCVLESDGSVLYFTADGVRYPLNHVFKDSGELAITSAITFTGTTAPSGTAMNTYQWNQVGKLVTIRFNLIYSVNGSAISAASFDLPSDCPTPAPISGLTTNNQCIATGPATVSSAAAGTSSNSSRSLIVKSTASVSGYKIGFNNASGTVNLQYLWASIQYFAL